MFLIRKNMIGSEDDVRSKRWLGRGLLDHMIEVKEADRYR